MSFFVKKMVPMILTTKEAAGQLASKVRLINGKVIRQVRLMPV